MFINRIRSLFNPEQFQGWGKRRNYFEGWYFKVLNRDETTALAIIPGVALDDAGLSHSFIQVLDGRRKTAEYYKFDYDSFSASAEKFFVSIGNNHFSGDSLSLDLNGLRGKLLFKGNISWPKSWYSPGIMGPYSFVPFMECYHGIVSMDHSITGTLVCNGETVNFDGGRGYIEKDWGSSFPAGYIWFQSNHFDEPGISIKTSVAKIPWLRDSFVGFICGIWLKSRLISFTTYNGSELKLVRADTAKIEVVIENKKYRIEIAVDRDSATALASPLKGHMEGRIEESMSSDIEVHLTDRRLDKTIFSGRGRNVAVEAAGSVDEILTG